MCQKEEVNYLGCYGATFPVVEENMIDMLKNKLKKLQQSGGLEDLQEQWKKRIMAHIKTPKDVADITHARLKKSWRVDPTLVIEDDIKTPKGEVLAQKGDRINPLHFVRPLKGFLFIDGLDEKQILFSKDHLKGFDIVLVKGSPLDVQEKTGSTIFFDQGGFLTTHYGIKHVPAFLKIEKDDILIEEVPIDE